MSLSASHHTRPGDRPPHPEGIASRPPFLRQALECVLAGIVAGLASTLALMAVVMLLSTLARAGETDAARPRSTSPGDVGHAGLLWSDPDRGYRHSPTPHTDVRIQVSGMLARVRVRVRVSQRFHNPDEHWREGIYVFPLPETAAVDHLRMRIGGRIIEGEIRERQTARRHYRRARAAGQRASLMEQERTNIFTTSVANIGPGENITVEIEYQQDIRHDQGSFHLRFPMVVAPRYLPGHTTRYRIEDLLIADASDTAPPRDDRDSASLILITCYPFDALVPGGPWRYLVRAQALAEPRTIDDGVTI